MSAAVLQLRGRRSWAPSALLAPSASEIWPTQQPLVLLGTLTQFVAAEGTAASDQAVVSPATVDPSTGVIRNAKRGFPGLIRTVGAERGTRLRPGDLLVPPVSSGHALLVGPEHSGFAFSAAYLALRPAPKIDSLQLWALLNSTPGQTARHAVAIGPITPRLTVSMLFELQVPVIPSDAWAALRTRVAALHQAAAEATTMTEVGQSWWRVAALPRGRSWSAYLATKRPDVLEEGMALEELAVEFRAGQKADVLSDVPRPNWLPYLSPRELRTGAEPATWAPSSPVVANPGDIVVAEAGRRGPAQLVAQPLIPGWGVSLIRLRDADLAPRVVAHLNSEPGQAVRALLVTGSFIPHFGLRSLRAMRIPSSALAGDAPVTSPTPAVPEPIRTRLDALLWN